MGCPRIKEILARITIGAIELLRDIYYGAALYPELWKWETVKKDISEMKKIGMNTARIGEFAWSTFEPKKDQFDFTILEDTLKELEKQNMYAILCTPTMTPPIWLTAGETNMMHQTNEGLTFIHGARQHVCTNNPFFRDRARVYAEKLAEFLKDYDNVIAVQLDNEFKAHVGPCYCNNCKNEWHKWLEKEYQDIQLLNEKWTTKIWSQEYTSFDQVVIPKKTAFLHNLSLEEAYTRFTHDLINDFAKDQADTIRQILPIPITHNSSFAFDLDNVGLFENLDFVSFDTYVDTPTAFVMNSSYWPNIKKDVAAHILMETSTSYPGHIKEYRKIHPKGFVEAESFITYASEGKGFLFWPFRQQKGGIEQPHGSVVSSWGEPTIGYQASQNIGELLSKTKDLLLKSRAIQPEIAVIYSDRAKSFLNKENGGALDYRKALTDYFDYFVKNGQRASLYNEKSSFDQLKLLCTPFMHHISDSFRNRALEFVEKGGIWLIGPMSGDRTEEHQWYTDTGLGKLGRILNVEGMMQFPSMETEIKAKFEGQTIFLRNMVTAVSGAAGAKVLGKIDSDEFGEGLAFLFEKQVGKGKIVFIGADLVDAEEQSLNHLVIQKYVEELSLKHEAVQTGASVLDFERRDEDGTIQHWLVNFSGEESNFVLEKEMVDIISGQPFGKGKHTASPYKYYVFID
ncbi:beta-galactosidase [Jeotgalibaca ciconiae]|uniref:Beta-galactosidase n=1 Tax=Jeotgalibaca ciconiae TaxID=2496265 RepID=A0A3S9H8X6_9LACT|nr:beta-galactosidase [Jeotgalibaca ciconiae]